MLAFKTRLKAAIIKEMCLVGFGQKSTQKPKNISNKSKSLSLYKPLGKIPAKN